MLKRRTLEPNRREPEHCFEKMSLSDLALLAYSRESLSASTRNRLSFRYTDDQSLIFHAIHRIKSRTATFRRACGVCR